MLPATVADINIAPQVVQWLRAEGVDVLHAYEEGWFRTPDFEILARALTESRYVLTHDSDFGKLAVLRGEPFYGIIHLRPGGKPPSKVMADLADLNSRNIQWERGMLAVFRNGNLRIRKVGMN